MRARIAVSPLGTLQARREGDAVQQLRIGSSWDQIMTTGPKRTLNATCGLSVNITLGAEFSPVKAGRGILRTQGPANQRCRLLVHRSIRPMSSAEFPRRTRASSLVIRILHIRGS